MDLFFWRNVNEHNTWKRKEGGVGQVITGEELKGIIWQTFVVLPGTRCLFIDNGVSQGELEPGKYTAESLYQRFTQLRLKSNIRMFVYDSADIHLDYDTGAQFYTKENVKTGGKLAFVIKIDDGMLFHDNFLKAKNNVYHKDLLDFVRGEIDHILSGFIVQHSFDELYGDLELRKQLLNKLELELKTTLRRIGVDLVHIPFFDWDEGAWSEAKDKSGELEVARMRMRVEIDTRNLEYERRRATTDLQLREALLEQEFAIKEDVARATMQQKGNEELEEVAQAKRLLGLKIFSRDTAVEMQSLNTEEEKLAFIDRLDEKRTMSQQQKFELMRVLDEKNLDHEMARDILVRKTKLMNEQEFDLLNQRYRHELKTQELKNGKELQDLEQVLLRGGAINEGELDKIRIQNDFDVDAIRLELEKRRREFERQQKVEDAKAERDVDNLEIEVFRAMKLAKVEMKAKEQLVDERVRDAAHRREIARMQQLNEMGPAALAAMADNAERAKILVQLARTQAFKGMSADEILAASASDSPEVAKAFQEKFRLAAMQAEKMLDMKDQHVCDIKTMGMAAQQVMGTVETTRAAKPVHATVAVSYCTRCGKLRANDAKYCKSCGYGFPGMG